MEITLEKIDLLRKRANVSYKEAKEALEKNGGNVVEALAFLEEENKIRPEEFEGSASSVFKKIKNIYTRASRIRLVITKNEATILNINLPLALLVAVLAMPLAAALLVLALLTDCRIRFYKSSGEECSINSSIENITSKASEFADRVSREIKID
ncbi:MAG: DUF4342 domain-containing protein [Peptococcaceae bacterium]|jgi:hypothetical protein|nr:DUF4342 domain-containing protein [Peptococcaceae bacterium]MDH7524579.1 DUF4342 domain-containing protein [Peptococcaceae bacterium]